jgi:hypothetical protein
MDSSSLHGLNVGFTFMKPVASHNGRSASPIDGALNTKVVRCEKPGSTQFVNGLIIPSRVKQDRLVCSEQGEAGSLSMEVSAIPTYACPYQHHRPIQL